MSQPGLIPERLAELDSIQLLRGKHKPDHEFCAMELLAYLAGERHSDRPACSSNTLGSFVRSLNDWMDDNERQQLKPYVVRMFDTHGTANQEQQRTFLCADWAIHFCAPLAFRLLGKNMLAVKLESLPPVSNRESASTAAKVAKAAAAASSALAAVAAAAAATAASYAATTDAAAAASAAAGYTIAADAADATDAATGYAAAAAAGYAAAAAGAAADDAATAAADDAADAAGYTAIAAGTAATTNNARSRIIESALDLIDRLIDVAA